jgi:hypothetical protein
MDKKVLIVENDGQSATEFNIRANENGSQLYCRQVLSGLTCGDSFPVNLFNALNLSIQNLPHEKDSNCCLNY